MRIQRIKSGKSWKVVVDGEEVAKGLTEDKAAAKVAEIVNG